MSNRQQTTQQIRDIMQNYNNNIQTYNLNMIDYNRNISSLINLFETNLLLNSRPVSNSFRSPIIPLASRTANIANIRPQTQRQTQGNTSRTPRTNIFNDDYYSSILLQMTNQIASLSPPRRGLTNEEISRNTRTIYYNSSLTESRCYITHEEFRDDDELCQIIGCGHYFKPSAIYRWFETSTTCPVCRHDLLEYRQNNEENINNMTNTTTSEDNEDTNDTEITPPPPTYRYQPTLPSIQELSNNFDNLIQNEQFSTDGSFNLTYSFEFPFDLQR